MNSSIILSIVTFIYGFAAFMYIVSWIFRKDLPAKIGAWTAVAAIIGNLAGFIMRWIESYQMGVGHIPLSNLYESLVFFALTIGVIYLVIEYQYKSRTVGLIANPLAFLAMAYASLSKNVNDQIQPLIPALKSNWLTAHVITCFLGYAAFGIAFGMSLFYLISRKKGDDNGKAWSFFPKPQMLDELTHQMVMFGFLFLSAGIITGSVWANSAWGKYWSWDPKETASLITWLVYATMLHARLMRGWSGKRIAYLSIAGFFAVLFTYFGVNLLPGLHSYGQ